MISSTSQRGIIVGVSSDIGLAIARDWLGRGISVVGSFRTPSTELSAIADHLEALVHCDFSDPNSIKQFAASPALNQKAWDYLVVCPGTMEPIGDFVDVDLETWCTGFNVNFLGTMRLLHALLPLRAASSPFVGLFAGSGTNSAPTAFSAYTLSKVSLIKAVELLDAEICNLRIAILGPGWVYTKIHSETLRSGDSAPGALAETKRRLSGGDFSPMSRVVECMGWAMSASKEVISGRNFSVVHDLWGSDDLEKRLLEDSNMYKLRRADSKG